MENKEQVDNSRRDFLKATGIGVAAMSMAGAGFLSNVNPVSAAMTASNLIETDILVIGGGMAGIFAAIRADEKGAKVTLADKGHVGKSGLSPFWEGTATYDPAYEKQWGLTEEKFMREVAKGEEYLANQTYWKLWIKHSHENMKLGESFGMLNNKNNKRGLNLRKALVDRKIDLVERTMITSLLKKDDRIVGAIGFSLDSGEAVVINSKAVIVACGSGTFKTPGWPGHSLTHDGEAMSYRAGAEITGKEFVDYHVTNKNSPGGFGVTGGGAPEMFGGTIIYPSVEVRGVLSDDMKTHQGDFPSKNPRGGHPENSSKPVAPLDLPSGPVTVSSGSARPDRPPMDGGPPVMVGGSSAGMAPHHCEGIVPQNDKCESSVKGLYGAGDSLATSGAAYCVTCTGSSNSYTFGAIAGINAAEYVKGVKTSAADKAYVAQMKEEMLAPRESEQGFSPRWVTQILQGLMVPYYVLNVKSEVRLKAALANVEFLRDQFSDKMLANDTHELRLVHETRNMLLNAEMKLRAGLFRTESRGAHFREEYPARDDKNWLAWVIIDQKGDGSMNLAKRDIPEDWKPSAKVPYLEKYPYTRYIGEEEYLKGKGIKI
jgi:succinate dehydrogenase/fumarate reductase flavoprotein subunit